MSKKSEITYITSFLLEYAVAMMGAGSHTARIVKCVLRMAESLGYEASLSIFQKNISMHVHKRGDEEIAYNSIRRIPHANINLLRVSELSGLSWRAFDKNLPLDQIEREYEEIINEPRYSRWVVLLMVALANTSFGWIFGADTEAMGIVFVATLIGFFVRQELIKRHVNHYLMFTLVSFIASMVAGMGVVLHIGSTPDIALATSVLFLIPGVPLINGLTDLLEGYVLVGLSRLMNAILLIFFLTFGIILTLTFLNINNLW